MEKIKKALNFKFILFLISVLFTLNSAVYAIDITDKFYLRPPMKFSIIDAGNAETGSGLAYNMFVPDMSFSLLSSTDIESMFMNKIVVFVEPHPDDVAMGMGMTQARITKVARKSYVITATVSPGGVTDAFAMEYAPAEMQKEPERVKRNIRISEARKYASQIGVTEYFNFDFQLKTSSVEIDHVGGKRQAYQSAYRDPIPEELARIHRFIDEHPDVQVWILPYAFKTVPHHPVHEKTNRAFIEALRDRGFSGEIWFYETMELKIDFDNEGEMKPNVTVGFPADEMKKKQAGLSVFASQTTRDLKYSMANADRNARYAEAYPEDVFAERFIRGHFIAPFAVKGAGVNIGRQAL